MTQYIYTRNAKSRSQKYHLLSRLGDPKCRVLLLPLDSMEVSDQTPDGFEPCLRCFPETVKVMGEKSGQAMSAITKFRGEFRFLSNFWMCDVLIDDLVWPATEHYYVAMKTLDPDLREDIRLGPFKEDENGVLVRPAHPPTLGQVKRIGRRLELRPDWDDIKIDVMRRAVTAKFTQNSDLLQKLLATGDAELIEGNAWGDTFWGVCRGRGENWLGRILMDVREQLREPLDIDFD